MSDKVNRRQFLTRAAGAGAALALPAILPARGRASARVLGKDNTPPPSEQIVMGFIGVGGMGGGHLGFFQGQKQVRIAAVCDVFQEHRERARERVGGDCVAYNDYRELLDRKDIDAVLIATPDHWHALTSIHACEAGKDVYCEKPMTLTIADGQAMVRAVRHYNRVFQTGSQQRSEWGFRFACELVRNGRIGKITSVQTGIGGNPTCGWEPNTDPPPGLDWNLWLGPAPWVPYTPKRCLFTFRYFWDYSGGSLTDWGAHHNDIAQWGLGMDGKGPIEVEADGEFPTDGLFELPVRFEVRAKYATGVTLTCASRDHGCKFIGTDGWIHVDRGFLQADPPSVLQGKLGPDDVHLYASPGHQADWLNCIKTRERPICDVEIGYRSVTICHLGNISIRTGRKLQWDPQTERIVNDEGANRWLDKPYRAPWHL